jgi:hypothetical protein
LLLKNDRLQLPAAGLNQETNKNQLQPVATGLYAIFGYDTSNNLGIYILNL